MIKKCFVFTLVCKLSWHGTKPTFPRELTRSKRFLVWETHVNRLNFPNDWFSGRETKDNYCTEGDWRLSEKANEKLKKVGIRTTEAGKSCCRGRRPRWHEFTRESCEPRPMARSWRWYQSDLIRTINYSSNDRKIMAIQLC